MVATNSRHELGPSESSATEDPEDAGDQGDADDEDMNALGAVCEEPVRTIGVDGEMLDGCENDEESYVDDVKRRLSGS